MAKKTTKKPAKKAKRRICSTKGCRKTALTDGDQCRVCVGDSDPQDMVLKTTELEALRWAKLDVELRNDRQAIQIIDNDCQRIKAKAEADIAGLLQQKNQISASITVRKPEYQAMVKMLADKYGIKDPNMMTIDPDTFVIRDLSKV